MQAAAGVVAQAENVAATGEQDAAQGYRDTAQAYEETETGDFITGAIKSVAGIGLAIASGGTSLVVGDLGNSSIGNPTVAGALY